MESTAAAASAARLREALCARAPVRVLSMPAFRYTEMDCGKSAWWRGKHPFFKHYFLFSKLTSSDFSEKCFNIPMNGSQQISITGIAELHFPPFTCFFFAASNYFPQIGCFCIRVKENAGAFCRKLSYCGSEGQENGSAITLCRQTQLALGVYLRHSPCVICTNRPSWVF